MESHSLILLLLNQWSDLIIQMASQERFMAIMLNVVPSIIVVVAMFEVDFTDERAVQISFPNHFPKVDSKFD